MKWQGQSVDIVLAKAAKTSAEETKTHLLLGSKKESPAQRHTHAQTLTKWERHTYSTLSASVLFWSSIHVERNCGSLRWQLGSCYHDNQELNKGSVCARLCVCARMCLGFEIYQFQKAPHRHSYTASLENCTHIVCQAHQNYSCELSSHLNSQNWVMIINWKYIWENTGGRGWSLLLCTFLQQWQQNKTAFVCCVVAAPQWVDTRWHLFRNPCSYTWKALPLFFWNREINKCPCNCSRI